MVHKKGLLYMKSQGVWSSVILCLLVSKASYAIPFNIIPKSGTALPTKMTEGTKVAAVYTITNNAGKQLNDSYIQYLPPHVTQVIQNPSISNLCGKTFNLAPKGSVGDSCTLQLSIDGAVYADDPNPQNHLFACLQGGKSCAGTYYPLNVHVVPATVQLVAAGYQGSQSAQGVVFVSQNKGGNWLFQALSIPEPAQGSSFSGSSCGTPNCVLAGTYITETTIAGVATSQNTNLTNWLQQILTVPDPNVSSNLLGVNCDIENCVAAGYYTDTTSLAPLIAHSTNAGLTWVQNFLPLLNPALYVYGYFAGVDCSGSNCVAAGSYLTQDFNQHSSVAYSMDGGNTWFQQVLPIVEGTFSNQLNGVSCIGLSCIAVGDYISDSSNNDYPGIAITHDGGVTWSNSILQTFPAPYTQGEWQAISCTTAYCVAVGYYSNVSYSGYLGVAMSSDFGKTWAQQALPLPTDPSGITNGLLKGVKCTGATCIATGNYFDNSFTSYPVFVTSNDSGQTWTQQVYANYAGVMLNSVG
jgi:hypothetical protein